MRRTLALVLAAAACAHGPRKPAQASGTPGLRFLDVEPALLYQEAREKMARGEWDEARERFDALLSKDPKSAAVLFDAGWIAEKRGDPKTAEGYYRRTLELEPQHLGAALNLARLMRDSPADAERVLRQALQHRDGDPALLDGLAAALREQGRLDEAEAVVRQVLARHPRDAGAHRDLAAIEADRGRLRLAETALNDARKLDPQDPGILNSLGILAIKRDELASARAYFEEAVRIDPAFAPAWANLGAIALQYRDHAAAEQAYAKAVQLDPARWEIRLAHGWALEGLKRPSEARAEFEKVLAMQPAEDDALYGRALALKAENDLAGALQAFHDYVTAAKAAHLKEARGQIASIEMRLKNAPPGAPPKPPAAAPNDGPGGAAVR